jgi:hypothetical protein
MQPQGSDRAIAYQFIPKNSSHLPLRSSLLFRFYGEEPLGMIHADEVEPHRQYQEYQPVNWRDWDYQGDDQNTHPDDSMRQKVFPVFQIDPNCV